MPVSSSPIPPFRPNAVRWRFSAPSSSALAHTVNGRSVAGEGPFPAAQQIPGRLPANQSGGLQQAVLLPLNPARPPVSAAFPEHLVEGIRAQPESTRSAPPRSRINMPGILRCKKGTCPNRFQAA
ncbi:MAG: hypothetical protein ACLSHC_05705 [Bilophila wadsworthia]